MKRKLARVLVYDQLADSPGVIPLIPQPLGVLATDPNIDDPLGIDPTSDELGSEQLGILQDVISINLSPSPLEIECDGDFLGDIIEAVRASTPYDDRPPGTLLGSVSYEVFGDVATITDWEHLNWQDDTPVRKAVQLVINELPDCVKKVRVLDGPRAFWTSLGFLPDYKGDQYLHLYLT